MKKNPDAQIFKDFAPQFEAFKQTVKAQLGCSDCGCNK